jgi:iron(III) transport system ATP-binding protein
MVFQSYALWPHMTVAENVAFGLEERRWPRERIRARVQEMLELVELAGYGERRPGQLSGGQQQRVAIARTLAIAPRVLLLDEPLSNLDARLRAATGLELKRLQRRLGLTTVFVTHDQQEAMTIADRLAVLEHGTIQQVGTPRELYDAPANRFVAEFVGSINLYPGRVETAAADVCVIAVQGLGRAGVPTWRVAASIARAGAAVAVAFRPHAVRPASLAPSAPAAASAPVATSASAATHAQTQAETGLTFDATIGNAEFLGEFVRYDLAVEAQRVVADLPHARFAETLAPGTRTRFAVAAEEILVLPDV